MGKRFVPITRRVNIIVIVALSIGIGGISFFFGSRLFTTIGEAAQVNLDTNGDIIYESIEALMLNGQADIAESYFANLLTTGEGQEVVIYRRNGVRAFQDNETITEVNQHVGMQLFTPRDQIVQSPMTRDDEAFEKATSMPPLPQQFTEHEGDQIYERLYRPLVNIPRCYRCHSTDHTVRGVISIRDNFTPIIRRRNATVITASAFFFGIVLALSIILTQFVRGTIIGPVKLVGSVCESVTGGDFSRRVQVRSDDEIGRLGETVNTMVEGLHERFELSKYVSSTTLSSLMEEKSEGRAAELTLFFSDIRGFTSYSEKNAPDVVVESLNRLLNHQTQIIIECGGDVDKYVGDEIVAIFAAEDGTDCACEAAIRIQESVSPGDFGGLHVGIGINRGSVILGMIGSDQRADFTVIGDNVNTASRLCDAAGPDEIIASESVRQAISREVELDGPYRVRVKGKEDSQRVYKLKSIGANDREQDDESHSE